MDAERFAAAPITGYRLHADEIVVWNPVTGTLHSIGSFESRVLAECGHYRDLPTHEANLRARGILPEGDAHEVADVLRSLVDVGLLRAESEQVERVCAQSPQPHAQNTTSSFIRTLLIPTADRPDALRRAVERYGEELRKHGRDTRLLVLDDSRSANNTKSVLDFCTRFSRHAGVTARVIGQSGRRDYAGAVAQVAAGGGVSTQTVEFALGIDQPDNANRYGVNRNLGLLLCAGGSYISADDDTLPEFARPTPTPVSSTYAPSIRSDVEFIELTPFDSWRELETTLTSVSSDPFSLIERFLGRHVGEICDLTESDSLDVDSGSANLFARLEQRPDSGRIRIVSTGLYGDTAMSNPPQQLFRAHREQRTQNVENKARYDALKVGRLVMRGSRVPTITDVPFLMGGCYAADATSILPPFLPVGRREDAFFAFVTSLVYSESLICHLPLAVRHEPTDRRIGWDQGISELHLSATEVLQTLLLEHLGSRLSGGAAERLRLLGSVLRGLGSLEYEVFLRHVTNAARGLLSRLAARVEAHLDWYDRQPRYWARDAEAYLETIDHIVQSTKPTSVMEDGAFSQLRLHCEQYGQLLLAWPEIWEAACEVNEQWVG